jgi:hypothetical protein
VSNTSQDYSIIDHSHPTELRRANQTVDGIDPLSIGNRSLRLASSNGEMDTTIDPFYQHSILESQSGIGKAEVTINELPKSNVDGDKNEMVRTIDIRDMKESRDLRWSTWWLIGAVLIVIPWVAIAASAPKTAMGGIRTTSSGSRFCGLQRGFSHFSTFILAEAGFGCANSTRA